jgi:hypothetical protein
VGSVSYLNAARGNAWFKHGLQSALARLEASTEDEFRPALRDAADLELWVSVTGGQRQHITNELRLRRAQRGFGETRSWSWMTSGLFPLMTRAGSESPSDWSG